MHQLNENVYDSNAVSKESMKQGAAKRRAPKRICNGVQNSRCSRNIRKIYIGCPHPHKPELGDGTQGTGPFRAVLCSNSFAANPWHGHLAHLYLSLVS